MAESAVPPVTPGAKPKIEMHGVESGYYVLPATNWPTYDELVTTETLAWAVDYARGEGWACACFTSSAMCCRYRVVRVERLKRAAHIAVRQMSDLRDRMAVGGENTDG